MPAVQEIEEIDVVVLTEPAGHWPEGAEGTVVMDFGEERLLEMAGQADDPGVRTSILLDTLSAFFSADRNGASAAAKLGVSRQTVTNRLRKVEECIAQPLSNCGDLLHVALRLQELGLFPDCRVEPAVTAI